MTQCLSSNGPLVSTFAAEFIFLFSVFPQAAEGTTSVDGNQQQEQKRIFNYLSLNQNTNSENTPLPSICFDMTSHTNGTPQTPFVLVYINCLQSMTCVSLSDVSLVQGFADLIFNS